MSLHNCICRTHTHTAIKLHCLKTALFYFLGTKMGGKHFIALTDDQILNLAPTPEEFLIRYGIREYIDQLQNKQVLYS